MLSLLTAGLRSVLSTVVVADDLIGPFSMYVSAGSGFMDHLRVSWDAASYGHFNYVGQIIGGVVNWTWMQLMLHGVRFSTIYFLTKLLVFTAVVYSAASMITAIGQLWAVQMNRARLRLFIALSMIATLQLHLVWSNDPVASYPMSGYASVVIGLIALRLCARALNNPKSWVSAILAALSLLIAVLYYEMNIALIPAIATLGFTYALSNKERRSNALRILLRLSMIYVIPTLIVVELQRQNAGESVVYEGTAIRLSGSMLTTFAKLTVSSLPYSSWHLASDWVGDFPGINQHVLTLSVFVLIAATTIGVVLRRGHTPLHPHTTWWGIPMLVIYWLAATGIQASTVKVQNEAIRIGYVYNFYAVGSVVVTIILALLMYAFFIKSRRKRASIPVVVGFLVLCLGQIHVNESIQEKHFKMLPQSRNLLVSFSEQWPLAKRCFWLEEWLKMGWPDYYSNSMTTGLERSYSDEFNQPFCGRF
jgi:hypothetical protein